MNTVAGLGARIAQTLGLNALPVAGVLGDWWSSGTALALYWIEGVVVIVLISARIALHRRWTRKAGHGFQGHFRSSTETQRATQRPGSFLSSYLIIAIPFTLAHGLFLGVLLFMLTHNRPDLGIAVNAASLRTGGLGMLCFLALGFLIDLVSLRHQSFRWLERMTERALGRIFVVHLTIIFGVGALALFDAPMGLLGVFAALKALVDLGSIMPHKELAPEPPRWLRWMNRFPGRGGETFNAYWRRTEESERQRREANERVLATPD